MVKEDLTYGEQYLLDGALMVCYQNLSVFRVFYFLNLNLACTDIGKSTLDSTSESLKFLGGALIDLSGNWYVAFETTHG